ncbi:MAG: ATP-binding protein [Thermoleophilia bacterium]
MTTGERPQTQRAERLRLPAVPASVRHARVWAAAEAAARGLGADALDSLRLAMSEAVANAVMHAYPGGDGAVHLSFACESGVLRFMVDDHGCGRAAAVSSTAGAGLGTSLMRALCDEFHVLDRVPGTRVVLGFALPGG